MDGEDSGRGSGSTAARGQLFISAVFMAIGAPVALSKGAPVMAAIAGALAVLFALIGFLMLRYDK